MRRIKLTVLLIITTLSIHLTTSAQDGTTVFDFLKNVSTSIKALDYSAYRNIAFPARQEIRTGIQKMRDYQLQKTGTNILEEDINEFELMLMVESEIAKYYARWYEHNKMLFDEKSFVVKEYLQNPIEENDVKEFKDAGIDIFVSSGLLILEEPVSMTTHIVYLNSLITYNGKLYFGNPRSYTLDSQHKIEDIKELFKEGGSWRIEEYIYNNSYIEAVADYALADAAEEALPDTGVDHVTAASDIAMDAAADAAVAADASEVSTYSLSYTTTLQGNDLSITFTLPEVEYSGPAYAQITNKQSGEDFSSYYCNFDPLSQTMTLEIPELEVKLILIKVDLDFIGSVFDPHSSEILSTIRLKYAHE